MRPGLSNANGRRIELDANPGEAEAYVVDVDAVGSEGVHPSAKALRRGELESELVPVVLTPWIPSPAPVDGMAMFLDFFPRLIDPVREDALDA